MGPQWSTVSSFIVILFLLGPPGPPGGLVVRDIKDTTVQLSWSRGSDNHSPIAKYIIQARTPLFSKWKQVRTSKCLEGSGPYCACSDMRLLFTPLALLALFGLFLCFWVIDPANIEGNAETAQVVNLIPWMDYEFRVLASNILGTGEPSVPSAKICTKEAGEYIYFLRKKSGSSCMTGLCIQWQ